MNAVLKHSLMGKSEVIVSHSPEVGGGLERVLCGIPADREVERRLPRSTIPMCLRPPALGPEGTQRHPGCVRQQSQLLQPGILVRDRVIGGRVDPIAGWGEANMPSDRVHLGRKFIGEGEEEREKKRERD